MLQLHGVFALNKFKSLALSHEHFLTVLGLEHFYCTYRGPCLDQAYANTS